MMRKFLILVAACALLSPVVASELPYTFVQGSWTNVDPDNGGDSGTGPMVDVSWGLGSVFHLVGSYQDVDFDQDDATVWEVGAGAHRTVAQSFDLFGEATYVDQEVDNTTLGSASDEGYSFCAGARKALTPAWEINGGLEYVDVGDNDDTLVGVNALYTMKERYAVGAGYKMGDFNTFHLGFRVNFGQR